MNHYSITIKGRVQGVFFRASAKDKAESLGIAGYAKNESDGSVKIEAEGDEERLKEFIEWCQKGPERADVKQVEVKQNNFKNFKKFDIRY